MSVLAWPRIYFAGYSYWNPSTFNNNDYDPPIDTYDPANAQLNWAYLHSQGVDSAEAFKKWSIQARTGDPTDFKNKVPPAEWNYYGGNGCGFVTQDRPLIADPQIFYKPDGITCTTGYTSAAGAYVDSGDPWLQLPLQFNRDQPWEAKLVDIDPTAFWSSQIFADSFTLGTPEAGFSAPVKYRLHSRWQYLNHNYNADAKLMIAGPLSAVFQTCFHTEDIQFHGTGSQLYAELREALQAPDAAGLMMRYVAYDTIYFEGTKFENKNSDQYPQMVAMAEVYQSYAEQLQAYKDGKTTTKPARPVNCAYSHVVGWIGAWKHGEWASAPGGRLLLPLIQPGQPRGLPPPQQVQAQGLPCNYYSGDSPAASVSLGPAAVEVQTNGRQVERLVVDLGTTIPEHDSTGKKAVFGQVRLELDLPAAQGGRVVLATLADDSDGDAYAAAYLKTAGVVDVPGQQLPPTLTADQIDNHPLILTVESYTPADAACTAWTSERRVALTENPLIAQTDQRGVYVNQPRALWQHDEPRVTFSVRVQQFGRAPGAGIGLTLAQYGAVNAEGVWRRVTRKRPGIAPYVELVLGDTAGDRRPIGSTTQLDASAGELTFCVRALRPGQPILVFYPLAPSTRAFRPPRQIPFPSIVATGFTVVRALPFHNQLAVAFDDWLRTAPAVDMVNQSVFDVVFRTYALMYPVMDFIADPLKFQEWRGLIYIRTDPTLFESAAYMPVTRALSAGQRRIIERYHEYLQMLPPGPREQRKDTVSHRVRRG
jgi:hypothetical protein